MAEPRVRFGSPPVFNPRTRSSARSVSHASAGEDPSAEQTLQAEEELCHAEAGGGGNQVQVSEQDPGKWTRRLSRAPVSARPRSPLPPSPQVIIERYDKEKFLPPLDKTKFLVPHELTMTQFVTIIRNRMALLPSQAFYLLINSSGLPSMSLTMAQVYRDHQDEDGFLYMTYASQEMFGL
ncbi:microtubule-associated proteins 1A/1B light chain 3C isoform X1 [Oryzias melastigma]|uniref:microtubule-associated proteins 1A/1B light chain 3C isoform X1 n=1 Tax=Oryzias melastigma TaxID=30732 RepID=UPI00168D8073|nr:microtubule-associated proteins 1A/1B light chain 3C isoform X1 [Oryzias melastigma]